VAPEEPGSEPEATAAGGSRYNVEVTGGKGVVVGDYATVVQFYANAPDPLSSHIRVHDFKALIDERTRGFVGRDFVFTAIDEALRDEQLPCGYVVIQGEPGIGKTALMGQLVKTSGYVHHFNVSSLGIRSAKAFLSSVCAQLIVRFGLDYAALPSAAAEDGGFLSRLLAEVAEKPANLPLVITIDALDEAEDLNLRPGANVLFLPPNLPAGVFFVVTTRPQHDYRLFVDPRRDIYLRDDDPQNLEDVRAYIRGFAEASRDRMSRQIERWGVTDDEFVEILTNKSEGNFMYLVHVLRDIRSDVLTADTIDHIQRLPQGLRAYYRQHWNAMKGEDQQRFRRYQEPVICLLATAREPVSLAQVVAWTRQYWARSGWNPDDLDRTSAIDVVREWREFLNSADIDGETRYRVYHASFQDFLRDEVGLAAYHDAISDAALAKIPGVLGGP
jgi:hypothetical protein